MAPLVRRRLTPVNYARELINAILAIRQQKQIPNFERISRFLQRSAELTPRKCKEHLNNAVSDGLIVEYTAVGVKGQRTGLEQEGYRVPQSGELMLEDYGHDWYCFECHGPGEVCECSSCFRVYHPGCTREDTSSETFTCGVCKEKEASRQKTKMKKKMLNTLLSYTILRLKEKTRELQKIGPKATADDFKRFVYRKMDLHKMEQKVQASRYRSLEEFHADACTILHNCTLLFGEEKAGLTELAVVMVRDCRYDLDEIELCANCYYMSNAKPEDWFSQPCNPPHDIVYAKQKGYSYWPAKVVKDLGGKFDVRFFGGWHQRAVIPAEYIKPITTDLKTMSIKKTGGFQKSMKELQRYQEILEERRQDLEAADAEKENEEEEEEEDEDEEEFDEDDDDEEFKEKEPSDNDEHEEDSFKEGDVTFDEDLDLKKVETPKKPVIKRKDSLQSGSKRAVKKPRVEADSENEIEDEVENRKVTSTSVEKHAKKGLKISSKTNSHDESYAVTSSVDKVGNSLSVPTVTTAVQTAVLETENSSTQTDLLETESVPDQSPQDTAQQQLNDKIWEDRMATALANLTKRLEEKFEEDKNIALKELSQQLEEDFGKDKQQAVERTIASMKQEFEKARKAGEDKAKEQYMEEMKKLAAKHKETVSQVKKKQWCQYCEEEAMYHCCWNTSYCSVKCQQEHWHKEHKRVCRRKRT
ncbi:unnamed protein product [Candidula unifasciata]|uniref:Zinc finger MYND domain-containing protein 11 n=1 Tax=Candidula unifasciata TaxID=100452 RepID=A0A8S3ZE76_9EUPU|nr:unnamed protein product [Candidula unifasciata]